MNGQVLVLSAGDYKMLTISPRCYISWMDCGHGSGNVLPDGAEFGGYQNGHQFYVDRKHFKHMGQSARYAALDSMITWTGR